MKSFLVIGLGRFGKHLASKLYALGNDVCAVDVDETLVSECVPFVTCARIADCTKKEVLKELSVNGYDTCFVCIGSDFQSSLQITDLLKELGAKKVVSKAGSKIQEKFLLRNGADVVVYPEKDLAHEVAIEYSSDKLFDFHSFSKDTSIYEVSVPAKWVNKSIKELNVRQNHNINILAIKRDDKTFINNIDDKLSDNDHLVVFSHNRDMEKFIKE